MLMVGTATNRVSTMKTPTSTVEMGVESGVHNAKSPIAVRGWDPYGGVAFATRPNAAMATSRTRAVTVTYTFTVGGMVTGRSPVDVPFHRVVKRHRLVVG